METADIEVKSTGPMGTAWVAVPDLSVASSGIRSVAKALLILELIARSGGEMTLTAIASTAKLNISTCHHLLTMFFENGFAARLRGKRTYILCEKLMFLHTAAPKQVNLPRRGTRVMKDLNIRAREAVQISVIEGEKLVTLLRKDALHPSKPDLSRPDVEGAALLSADLTV